jgi:hypothetical protein
VFIKQRVNSLDRASKKKPSEDRIKTKKKKQHSNSVMANGYLSPKGIRNNNLPSSLPSMASPDRNLNVDFVYKGLPST